MPHTSEVETPCWLEQSRGHPYMDHSTRLRVNARVVDRFVEATSHGAASRSGRGKHIRHRHFLEIAIRGSDRIYAFMEVCACHIPRRHTKVQCFPSTLIGCQCDIDLNDVSTPLGMLTHASQSSHPTRLPSPWGRAKNSARGEIVVCFLFLPKMNAKHCFLTILLP